MKKGGLRAKQSGKGKKKKELSEVAVLECIPGGQHTKNSRLINGL